MSKRRTTTAEALTNSGSPKKRCPTRTSKSRVTDKRFSTILERAREIDARRAPDGSKLRAWKVEEGIKYLSHVDETFGVWIREKNIPTHLLLQRPALLPPSSASGAPPNYFPTLFRTIISQQLAGAAAQTIHGKSLKAYGVKEGEEITVEEVLNASYTERCEDGKTKQLVNGEKPGLSRGKVNYIRSLAEHFADKKKLKGVDLESLSDEELRLRLEAVKGLGLWSVQMFQIFKLRRPRYIQCWRPRREKGSQCYSSRPARQVRE